MLNPDQKVPAAEFKAKCLQLMDEVEARHVPIVITKRGKPIARLVPYEEAASPFGFMKGSVTILGDIVAPTGERWEADE
ncbi:MAG TPA: type II toxin-antitoxin system Phd/YefM family antitoxin [Oscillatoriaceae cyanobacterium]